MIETRPEENIRNALIARLCQELGFPSNILVKERAISQLPHFSHRENLPNNRRIDLIAYYWEGELLKPLVLFECKHHRPKASGFQQLMGYNHWIQAPFLAWVSEHHEGLFQVTKQGVQSLGVLQSYEELCQHLIHS